MGTGRPVWTYVVQPMPALLPRIWVSVTVSGYRSHVAAVSASDIEITADVSGLSAGQSAPLTWQWVGKDAMPQDLEVSVPETAQIRAQ